MPALSAPFSPSVNRPFTFAPSTGLNLRVFVHDAVSALLEFRRVLLRPPVAQIAVGIELTALIVEAVRQLMPDYGSDSAEVHGHIR